MKTLMLNQKSKMTLKDIETYVTELKTYENKFVIFPSSIYLTKFVESGYTAGVQNIAAMNLDNQTGELTAKQVKSAGARYVIIGHSERRTNQAEDSELLLKKFNEAIENSLNVVFCVGESLVEYKLKSTNKTIIDELSEVLLKVKIPSNLKVYIAYEPIWAIGTGLTPTNYEIEKVMKLIKGFMEDSNFSNYEVLYGGSVNDQTIDELLKVNEIDGFLVGGASNDYKKTVNICEKLMNSTK